MSRCVFALLAFLVVSSTALAQQAPPTSYTLVVTPNEADMIFVQLGKLDWVTVNPLMQKLISQIQAQNRAAVAPAPPKE